MEADKHKLRKTLRYNALFSFSSGVIAMSFSNSIAIWMGVPEPLIIFYTGMILVFFSLFVFWVSLRSGIVRPAVKFIIIQDIIWVLSSAIIISGGMFNLAIQAYWMLAGLAIIVGYLAWNQVRYFTRL